jgi:cellulose synthase/poly-beta-1,6-N-acetylglucosamine synthase-like glycosyltransferase
VWIDDQPRVACVTQVGRVAGRHVTTLEGLDHADAWASAFSGAGASQCGFCTPGIIMRCAALDSDRRAQPSEVRKAMLAHLCRCTGWQSVIEAVAERGLDPARTIVCVMDADGRLSPNATDEVLARFDRPRVGGVQLPVRIRNRDGFLGRMQDLEFWGMSAIAQMARIRTRSVSLGGNGQFTRLSALQQVGPAPWSSALTEDLDLGLELTLRGWDLECAPAAWVSQQGVETVRALLRQRTRWYQGHIGCSRKAPDLWESELVERRTALETTLYLATPVFVILPWSIAFTLALWYVASLVLTEDVIPVDGVQVHVGFYLAFWYLLTFLPAMMLGLLYAERSRTSRVYALLLAHAQVFYSYVNLVAAWRAVVRIALRRETWAKTARVAEESP